MTVVITSSRCAGNRRGSLFSWAALWDVLMSSRAAGTWDGKVRAAMISGSIAPTDAPGGSPQRGTNERRLEDPTGACIRLNDRRLGLCTCWVGSRRHLRPSLLLTVIPGLARNALAGHQNPAVAALGTSLRISWYATRGWRQPHPPFFDDERSKVAPVHLHQQFTTPRGGTARAETPGGPLPRCAASPRRECRGRSRICCAG